MKCMHLSPRSTRYLGEAKQENPAVYRAYQLDELLGYAFESIDYSDLQGFSAKPIRLFIGMDTQGVLTGVLNEELKPNEQVLLVMSSGM